MMLTEVAIIISNSNS